MTFIVDKSAVSAAPITTFQARAAQREAVPGRIRRGILIVALLAAIVPAVQFGEHVARKTAATVALAEKCRGIPECNPLQKARSHD